MAATPQNDGFPVVDRRPLTMSDPTVWVWNTHTHSIAQPSAEHQRFWVIGCQFDARSALSYGSSLAFQLHSQLFSKGVDVRTSAPPRGRWCGSAPVAPVGGREKERKGARKREASLTGKQQLNQLGNVHSSVDCCYSAKNSRTAVLEPASRNLSSSNTINLQVPLDCF